MSNLTAARVSTWKFQEQHVQPSIDDYGTFIRAGSVLLAAGPATLSSRMPGQISPADPAIGALDMAFPIGVVENFALAQNKQLQTLFEIGSDIRYFIPGRVINNCSLSRVLIDGPSLLKVMYGAYLDPAVAAGSATLTNTNGPVDIRYSTGLLQFGTRGDVTRRIKDLPGQDHMFLNLASDLFNFPIGLLVMFKNSNDQLVAASYLEKCMVNAHNMNVNASSVLVAEAVSLQFDKVRPVNLLGTVADTQGTAA